MSVNKVILVGNIGKDIEVKAINETTKVGKFSLATNETYRDKSGVLQKKTEWHNIEVWSPILSDGLVPYLTKGTQIYLEGKIQSREYVDPKDNINRKIVEIRASEIRLLGSPKEDNNRGNNDNNASQAEPNYVTNTITPPPIVEDDLPF
jgi:single-strand DNA-binding protein